MLNTIIIGCGDIGTHVGQTLQQHHHTITAVVRTLESAAQLTSLGFNPIISDLDRLAPSLPVITDDALIFYFAPPPGSGEHDPRMANFLRSLSASAAQPRRLVYISTTAVYGNSSGDWIDEQTPTHPVNSRGKRRLDAETQLIEYQQQHPIKVTILRVPGIYSANRLPFQQIKAGKPILKQQIAPYSNRIHAIDLSEICIAAALSNPPPLAIYNVSDGNPGSISQYFREVALAFGLQPPPEISWEEAEQQISPAMLSYLSESKRIDNSLIIEKLGISLRYPTLEAGLRQCVEALKHKE